MIGGLWDTAMAYSGYIPTDNITVTSLVLLTTIAVWYLLSLHHTKVLQLPFPSGPWGLPVVGHLLFLGKNPVETITKYREKYGDIFAIRMGSHRVVVLNGFGVIRKALTRNLEDFSGRPKLYINIICAELRGGSLAFSDYDTAWKVLHRIAYNALKMFASYRNNPVEEIILEQSAKLTEFLLEQNGSPINPQREITLAGGSVIYQILFGRQSNIREDKTYLNFTKNLKDFVELTGAGNPVDVMPWTRFIFRKAFKKLRDVNEVLGEVTHQQTRNHQETFDATDLRDVTDALILAAKDITPDEEMLGLSTKRVIEAVVNDFLAAGSETVATALDWLFLYLATHPDVQAKVHAEIDEHIGMSRLPTYEDRKSMSYVEATILEVFRKATIVPLGLPHATTRDVEFMGYHFPKDTFVLLNFDSTCSDATVWDDPENFRPERFICDQGIDSTKAEMVMTFGAGRRRCIGEFLAKVEMFVFSTSILQKCTFKTVPGEVYDFGSTYGLTLKPKPYKLIVESRYL